MPINDPRDIPDLLFWLSAEAEAATYLDGQVPTQWTDLSGNGNHHPAVGTPKFRATAGESGGPAIEMSTGYFERATNPLTGTAGELRFHVKSNTGSTDAGFHAIGQLLRQGQKWVGDGNYRESFGRSLSETGVFPAGTTTAWSTHYMWVDGVAGVNGWGFTPHGLAMQYENSGVAVRWMPSSVVGAGARGVDETGRAALNGHMTLALAYSRTLTATERTDLDAWIAAHPNGGSVSAAPPSLSGAVALSRLQTAGGLDVVAAPGALSGAVALSRLQTAGGLDVVAAGSWVDAFPDGATPLTDTTIVGGVAESSGTYLDLVLGAPSVDGVTYEIEVTVDDDPDVTDAQTPYLDLYGIIPGNQGAEGGYPTLAATGTLTKPAALTVLTLTIGPGVEQYDTAVTDGKTEILLSARNLRVHEIRYRAASTTGNPVLRGAVALPQLATSGALTVAPLTTVRADRSNGRDRVMQWTVTVEPPIVPPTRELGHDYAKVASLPDPTLINGRPT